MKKIIKVRLGNHGYRIHIGEGFLGKSGSLIRSATAARKILVLTVPRVWRGYGVVFKKGLKAAGLSSAAFVLRDGEAWKNQDTLFLILKKMAQLRFQRDCALVTLGGGVVGDMGGLAASLYMRGIDLIHCPTTFLAQVDASVGGKTAIDFQGIKNLIGSFHQPKLVLIDPSVLKTLDDRQFKTGLAEVIKYGVIRDGRLFSEIENNLGRVLSRDPKVLSHLIERSCAIKAQIVSRDEKEKGERAWLNYGHTLGHALESYFRYEVLTHGEAVAYGMWFAALLSRRLGLCEEAVVSRQFQLLRKVGLFRKIPAFNPGKILAKMTLDKKARGGKTLFILTRKIGLVTIQKNVPPSVVLSTLDQFQTKISELT